MGVTLPSKENALFKQIVKFYETKQYKKGLKAADQILKKFPEHGETLAMKGLTLNCLNKKQEGYECVRKGLKFDLKSHVCWHVYGLLYRSDRDYNEAIKCYRNALKQDKDNLQILRDLSLLQIQMRDVKGLADTKRALLRLKPTNRNHWIGFAIALHLGGNLGQALEVLRSYHSTLDEVPSGDYEVSEMLLYMAEVLEEQGQYADALDHLDKSSPYMVDKLAAQHMRAHLLHKLGRLSDATAEYRQLLHINPENLDVHIALQKCVQESAAGHDKVALLTSLYDELKAQFPSSSLCRRLPLTFSTAHNFRRLADEYARACLRKGLPSLFNDLKSLYDDSEKALILQDLFAGYVRELSSSGKFPGAGEQDAKEAPSTLLWAYYYLGQHFDLLSDTTSALANLDAAILHTPTVVDLYVSKARVFKHAGDVARAYELAEKARTLDLADRFLNSKATLYALRASQPEQAEKTIALFTKDGDATSTPAHLYDMQCMWYELEVGECWERERGRQLASDEGDGLLEAARALKKYWAVEQHFTDMVEDQFDFHTYCLRKMTLRSYIRLLRFEDTLRNHRFFFRAATGAVRCYLSLYDAPKTSTAPKSDTSSDALSESERKKLASKAKREKLRADEKAAAASAAAAAAASAAAAAGGQVKEAANSTAAASGGGKKGASGKHSKATSGTPDPDPDGQALLQGEPLKEATKFVRQLQQSCGDRYQTHALAFDLYYRKQRYVLALAALKRLHHMCASTAAAVPELHERVARLALVLCTPTTNSASPALEHVFRAELPALLGVAIASSASEQAPLSPDDITSYLAQWEASHLPKPPEAPPGVEAPVITYRKRPSTRLSLALSAAICRAQLRQHDRVTALIDAAIDLLPAPAESASSPRVPGPTDPSLAECQRVYARLTRDHELTSLPPPYADHLAASAARLATRARFLYPLAATFVPPTHQSPPPHLSPELEDAPACN